MFILEWNHAYWVSIQNTEEDKYMLFFITHFESLL
jgi:hypothetical protein